jgi:phage terminase large subunit GpA-like protein
MPRKIEAPPSNPAVLRNTYLTFIEFLKALRIEGEIPSVTAWAEENRYLPPGSTERPGMWEAAFAPYTVEIQDAMHPDSPVRIAAILKSTQSLMTTTAENVIGHSIKYALHNIMYVISDQSLAAIRSSYAIDTLIDRCGLAEYVGPVTRREKQRKSGDRTLYKELSGGRRFMMCSYKSLSALDSLSWDLIIMDELDKAPPVIKNVGDPEGIIEARGRAVKNLKVLKLSTSSMRTSRIYEAFKKGDRREYMIPCPRCGGFQWLEMMKDGREYGLYGDYTQDDKKKPSLVEGSVRYKCKLCGKDFFEYEKEAFMAERSAGGLAYWEPQAKAQDERDRSYHISAMMSPLTSWRDIISDWVKTDFGRINAAYKNFVIINEGLPYLQNNIFTPWQALEERAEDYPLGKLPDGAYVITGGVDVQKNRLELQLVGWGRGMEAWSFAHEIFLGETADPGAVCWKELAEYCLQTYGAGKGNTEIGIANVGIDVSYNPNRDPSMKTKILKTDVSAVYNFCAMSKGFFIPLRGQSNDLRDMIVKKRAHVNYGINYWQVDVNAIKSEFLETVDLPEGPGALHISKDYTKWELKQFVSEIWTEIDDNGKMGFKKINERNEMLDTYVYARAVASILGIDRYTEADWDERIDAIEK